MIFDKQNLFSNDQAVTNSQASTNYIDLARALDGDTKVPQLGSRTSLTAADRGSSTR